MQIFCRIAALLLAAWLLCCAAAASDRSFVIAKINSEYYAADRVEAIQAIRSIDTTLDDDAYFKEVFRCLDRYSVYYTAEEYERALISDSRSMISADISDSELRVKIDHFGYGIEEQFRTYLEMAEKKNVKAFVLDLTDCPGGYVSVMNEIASMILPSGEVVTVKLRDKQTVYYSDLKTCPFAQITVRVSSKTASAAEIMAADLQTAGVATVVGVNSYGKTSVQRVYRLENGGAIKLTCGEYLTRDRNAITALGLAPDVIDYSYPLTIRWNENCRAVLEP